MVTTIEINMDEKQVEEEVEKEYKKSPREFAKDAVREANNLPRKEPASVEQNLDIIKHLIKRLTIHQTILEDKAGHLTKWLIILSVIMALGVVIQLLPMLFSFYKFIIPFLLAI